jgi:hypothetical protein
VIEFDGSVDCLKWMGASRGQAPNGFQFSRRSPNIEERPEGYAGGPKGKKMTNYLCSGEMWLWLEREYGSVVPTD